MPIFWANEGDAITSPGGGPALFPTTAPTITSTSTIRLPSTLGGGLAMFGPHEASFGNVQTVGPGSAWTSRHGDLGPFIGWRQGNADSGAFTTRTALNWTAVPSFKANMSWGYEKVVAELGSSEVVASSDTFHVLYKDPSVVELPDGSWLMLLARVRFYDGDNADHTNSLGDIVAWWSPDPTFASDQVVGPLLVVDSLCALPLTAYVGGTPVSDPYGVIPGSAVRLWLGVPGGVVDPQQEELLVYYVAEKNAEPASRPKMDAYAPGATYEVALADADFTQGIYLKRIQLADLQERIAAELGNPFTYTAESSATGFGRLAVIPGTLEGRVAIWSSAFEAEFGLATHFDAIFKSRAGGRAVLKLADPQPTWTNTEGLALVFAAVYNEEGGAKESDVHAASGHGIWRAAAVDGSNGAEFDIGGDLLGGSGGWDDQIVAADGGSQYLDPDPVQLDDGSWVVYVGQNDQGGQSSPLLRFHGDGAPSAPAHRRGAGTARALTMPLVDALGGEWRINPAGAPARRSRPAPFDMRPIAAMASPPVRRGGRDAFGGWKGPR